MFKTRRVEEKRVHLPTRGHTILKEATAAANAGDLVLAYQLCDKTIQSFRALLKVRALDFRAREGLRRTWALAGQLFPARHSFEVPTVAEHDWLPIKDPQLIKKVLRKIDTYFTDTFLESEWKKQCVGKYGGKKPSDLSWKNFYLQNETIMERYIGTTTELKWAIEMGHTNLVKEKFVPHMELPDYVFKEISLDKAILSGFDDIVAVLLSHGLDVNTVIDGHWSLLHYAVYAKRLSLVKQLVNRGADIHLKDKHGITPLFWAVRGDAYSLAEFLIEEGAQVTSGLSNGLTLLSWSVAHNQLRLVKKILSHGGSTAFNHPCGYSLLHIAAIRGFKAVAKCLIEHDLDPNATDLFGRTPLHWASQFDHRDMAELLLVSGANPHAEDKYRVTPKSIAEDFGHKSVRRLFKG